MTIPYFSHNETYVFAVPSVDEVLDKGHGVNLVRKGVSGKTRNLRLEFNMSINNPALTGLVPVIYILPGSREDIIAMLVQSHPPRQRSYRVGLMVGGIYTL